MVATQVGRHRFLACSYRFLAAKRQAKAEIFPRTISTTELPSNPSPLTFRNNPSKSYRPLRHTQPWQPTSLGKIRTHTGRPCHTNAHTYNERLRDKKANSPAAHPRTGGEVNVVLHVKCSYINQYSVVLGVLRDLR